MSKYDELRAFVSELYSKKIPIDVIAIQEVWEIRQPELLPIPGFQTLIFKSRKNMRGGGVGFYVREGLNCKIVENFSPFEQKIFEAITIQISYPNKSVLLTSAYRSNGLLPNLTAAQQMERFQFNFGELLSKLNSSRLTSYVFIDSNVDLLNMNSEETFNYLNNVLSNGFIQQIMKATRFQNQSKTLLDHILTTSRSNRIFSGTIVSDVSDHFFTFIRPVLPTVKKTSKSHYFSKLLSN
jgi:exonuclease III